MYRRLGVCLCRVYVYLHVCTQVMHAGVCVCVCVIKGQSWLYRLRNYTIIPSVLETGSLTCT